MTQFSDILSFPRLAWEKRRVIGAMTRREVKGQFAGSFLGIFWAFINPLIQIGVFWFVFSIGFKARPLNDVPFVVWLTAGMAPWFLFSNVVNGATSVIAGHSHLIKKTIFSAEILPVIKICSGLITHCFFVCILLGLLVLQGLPLSWWTLQFLYYLLGLLVFALGLAWMTSALFVFVRDVGQIVAVGLQVGFWMTPVFWDINMMPQKVKILLQCNPVYYVVQGYRESFITWVPFWHHPVYTLYFWLLAIGMLIGGYALFKKLAVQFSDVL